MSPLLNLHNYLGFYPVLSGWFGLAVLLASVLLAQWYGNRLERSARKAGKAWTPTQLRGMASAFVPFFVFGAVGALLVFSEAEGRVWPEIAWVRDLAVACSAAIALFGLHTLLTARRLLSGERSLWRAFWSAPPADVADWLNPQDRRGCPIYVVTGLADEAAGGLFFAQVFAMLTRPLLRLVNSLFLFAVAVLGVMMAAAVLGAVFEANGAAASAIDGAVKWVNHKVSSVGWFDPYSGFDALRQDLIDSRPESQEIFLWVLTNMVMVLAGSVLAVSLLHSLALFVTGTDVPLLSLRAMPIVQQAPVGRSTIVTADLSGAGRGLHHSRVYGTRTDIGTWMVAQVGAM